MSDWTSAVAEIKSRYKLQKWVMAPDALPLTRPQIAEPLPLPMRVEMFWRRENFQPIVQMNLCAIRRLGIPVDVPALKKAIGLLVARHEPLRSELLLAEGSPAQRILPDWTAALETVDLTAADPAQRDLEEARRLFAFAQQPIDLFSGPTFRSILVRKAPGEHVLGLVLHHYFGDAKSLQVLFADLLSLYASILAERDPQLPILRWQYADYALWQRNFAAEHLDDFLAYWGGRLNQAPWLGLSPPGTSDAKKSAMQDFAIPADISLRLGQVARQAKTTVFAVSLAAYQLALSAVSGKADIVTAVPVAARARRDFANTVGYLMNALPIHTHVDRSASVADQLKIFGQKLMADYFRQDISYELFEEYLPGPQPISTNMFNFVPKGFSHAHSDFDDSEIAGYSHPEFDRAMHARPRVRVMKDFVLFLSEESAGLAGLILYNSDNLAEARIRAFIEEFAAQAERFADAKI